MIGTETRTEPEIKRATSHRVELWMAVVIFLVAVFLRVYQLDVLPPGISHDEAMNGLDVINVLDNGAHPIYFEANQGGREPFFIYLDALFAAVFGKTVLALRLASASVSIATLIASYFLVKRLFSGWVATFALGWLALSFWDIAMSRNNFRALSLPLFMVPAFYLLWLGLEKKKLWYFVAGGFFFGGIQYTYFSDRVVPLLFLLFLGYLAIWHHNLFKANIKSLGLYSIIGLVVFAPLGLYYLGHPQIFFARIDQVAASGSGVQDTSALTNFLNALGMFSIRGDYMWRSNLANQPVFGILGSLFFYLGLIISLRSFKKPAYAFSLIWLAVMILPTALSTESPQYLRSMGMIPAVFVFPALGLAWFLDFISRRFLPRGNGPGYGLPVYAVLSLAFAVSSFLTFRDYFQVWASKPEVYDAFHTDMNEVGRYLSTLSGNETIVLSSEYFEHPSALFLAQKPLDIRWTNAVQSLVFPLSGKDVIYIFPSSAMPENLGSLFPERDKVKEVEGPAGKKAFVAYRLSQDETQKLAEILSEGTSLNKRLGNVELLSFRMGKQVEPGDKLPLTIAWKVLEGASRGADYAFFSHLIDVNGKMWGQGDANEFRTGQWRPGDVVVGNYNISVQADAPPGKYTIDAGIYDRWDGTRLSAPGNLKEDQVSLGFAKVLQAKAPDVEKVQNRLQAKVGDSIEFLGYDVMGGSKDAPSTFKPGDKVELNLYWLAKKVTNKDFSIFAQVLSTGGLLSQQDSQPAENTFPTSLWDEGEVVADKHEILLPAGTPPGEYRLVAGMYLLDTGKRLDITLSANQPMTDYLDLGTVKVVGQ